NGAGPIGRQGQDGRRDRPRRGRQEKTPRRGGRPMISHSESTIFTPAEIELLDVATMYVGMVREAAGAPKVRCHELARAVGWMLHLEHQDGYYGFVDHTWLWTSPLEPDSYITDRLGFPNILDVYCVGSLPMVRLVDAQHPSLPHVGWAYRPSVRPRDDIDG